MVAEKFVLRQYGIAHPIVTFYAPESLAEGDFNNVAVKLGALKGRKQYTVTHVTESGKRHCNAVQEMFEGEAIALGLPTLIIPAGNYLAIYLENQQSRDEAFEVLHQHPLAEKTAPSICYYRSTNVVVCLVRSVDIQLPLYSQRDGNQ